MQPAQVSIMLHVRMHSGLYVSDFDTHFYLSLDFVSFGLNSLLFSSLYWEKSYIAKCSVSSRILQEDCLEMNSLRGTCFLSTGLQDKV